MTDQPASRAVDRRGQLLALKLQALVRDHDGRPDPRCVPRRSRSGPRSARGDEAWVLFGDPTEDGRGLGAALIWAARGGACSLSIVAEQGAGVIARRAAEFSLPVRRVGSRTGVSSCRSVAAALGPPVAPRPEHLAFVTDIKAAGAVPVIEHGVVTGEVRGPRGVPGRRRSTDPMVRVPPRGRRRRARPRSVRDDARRRPDREALAGVVARWPRFVTSTARLIRSTGWRRSGSCAGGSSRSRGWLGLASVEPARAAGTAAQSQGSRTPCSALRSATGRIAGRRSCAASGSTST